MKAIKARDVIIPIKKISHIVKTPHSTTVYVGKRVFKFTDYLIVDMIQELKND